jgi:hypothetical protein
LDLPPDALRRKRWFELKSVVMNYEGIAARLYGAFEARLCEQEPSAFHFHEPFEKLPPYEREAWIAVAKEAHRVIAAAVLT